MDFEDEPTELTRRIRRKRRIQRGIYIVPSFVTSIALFLGFFAIIYTLQFMKKGSMNLEPAVIALIFAGVFDNLDGRLARLMKVESEFGVQFDSIADMVSFGVAPAILAYGFALVDLDRLGWLGAFMFLACAGIRLARFNVQSNEQPNKKYFKGMSSPVAAGGLGLSMVMMQEFLTGKTFAYGVLAVTIFISLLMVSNVRFRTFKEIDFKKQRFQVFLILLLAMMSVFVFSTRALFVIFIIYLLAGLIEEFLLWRRRRKSDPNVPFLPIGDRE